RKHVKKQRSSTMPQRRSSPRWTPLFTRNWPPRPLRTTSRWWIPKSAACAPISMPLAKTVEDKRFDKKNRALNEPIFFYTSGTKLPEELVINKVAKDTVSGYISIPKANSQQQASSTTSGR